MLPTSIVSVLPPGTVITGATSSTGNASKFTVKEIGVAWLPYSLVATPLAQGQLVSVEDALPAQALTIRMVRLAEAKPEFSEQIWQRLAGQSQSFWLSQDQSDEAT